MRVASGTGERNRKAATAARIYDYYLGGTHNFPVDVEVAKRVLARNPSTSAMARTNRAFLRRAVRFLVDAGVRQFLDIGSGMPTVGNVHEVAQRAAPDSRVVYVDIDPVAVSESQELLAGNPLAIAVQGDVRAPERILGNGQVRKLLDFSQPVGLLLVALLHFVPGDEEAYGAVATLADALAPGSYLVISHFTTEAAPVSKEELARVQDMYQRQTATPFRQRNRAEVARFFAGRGELVDPGVVWVPQWRPAADAPADFADDPSASVGLAAVGRLRD